VTARVPIVCIVGRPNVGKSTLFNRLIRKRKAITLDTPGITRDPIEEDVEWEGRTIRLVDTGGLGGEADIALADRVHQHTLRSIAGADLAVVLLDARAGLLPADADTVEILSEMQIPVVYVANKADGVEQEESLVEFCALGIDPPLAVSAEHNLGISALRSAILAALKSGQVPEAEGAGEVEEDEEDEDSRDERPCRVALVGRPNVGKSSWLNRIAGEALSLVDATPGTTRDVVDTEIERGAGRYLFLDTAGMRRPSRIDVDIEKLSVGRSLEAVRRCDVVVLLIEPEEGMTDQDARIAQYAITEGRALLIAVNKIDLVAGGRAKLEEIRAETFRRYPTLEIAPLVFLSALEGKGLDELFEQIDNANSAHSLEVQTSTLNRIIQNILERRDPPVLGRARLKLFYSAQTAKRPPTFTLFANRESVPAHYRRFMERCFRELLPLEGTPIRLRFARRASHGERE
jgi:GTP-binding protein